MRPCSGPTSQANANHVPIDVAFHGDVVNINCLSGFVLEDATDATSTQIVATCNLIGVSSGEWNFSTLSACGKVYYEPVFEIYEWKNELILNPDCSMMMFY